MYTLVSNITIGDYQFEGVHSVNIERSAKMLADTAIIELPLQAVFENKDKKNIAKQIKRGDAVTIELGYDNNLEFQFKGFVKSVTAKEKTVIECEDNAFLLRKNIENKSFQNTTLQEVMQYIATQTNVELSNDLPEINFSSFILQNVTGLQAVKQIKDKYGLQIFFQYDGKLYAGLAYTYDTGDVIYDLQKNVIQSDLEFKSEDELLYKIKAISIQKDNSRIEVEFGDDDGEQRTFYFYDIEDKTQLEELAKEELQRVKYTGYQGTLTAFGLPPAKYGMTATIKDANYPQREGNYYISSVKMEFGQNGYHNTVELGIKL